MTRGALIAGGLTILLAGAGMLGVAMTRKSAGGMSQQTSAAVATAIGQLDGDIKAARATAHERAATIAGLDAVQGAVATNYRTVQELAGTTLAFHPDPGEVIEVGQLAPGEIPKTLLVEPSEDNPDSEAMCEATASQRGKPGSYLELMGTRLAITEVANVVAKQSDQPGLAGYVIENRPLDLAPALALLASAGAAGHVEVGATKVAFGTPVPGSGAQAMALPSQPDVRIVIAVPPAHAGTLLPLEVGGGAAALLGLSLLVLGLTKKPLAAGAPFVSPAAPTLASAPRPVASGTPPPQPPVTAQPMLSDTAAYSVTDLGAGSMLGRWEIIKRLGSGGMADVYLARSRGEAGFEKLVAVKIMHPHLARNERAVDHFLDEARLAAGIAHPNVVAIQDLGKIGNDYAIVMEYVDGVDLERLLMAARAAQRQVPVDVGLGILRRVCDGLNAAHRATAADGTPLHIVHRDVKSANVLVSRQGGVKVVDFGIAKAARQSHLTVAGESKGTPSMMAPEQRIGEQVDVRADVYALGAVGFELLTGHAVNLDLALLAHLGIQGWPHLPAPTSLRPQLPPELDAILLGAMAYERERRPADCAAFEASLEAVMKAHGLSASDKDIARWVNDELAQLQAPPAAAARPA